jgi:hypothetical protein
MLEEQILEFSDTPVDSPPEISATLRGSERPSADPEETRRRLLSFLKEIDR